MNERFDIDEIQGEAILQMRLRRLTGLARDELVAQIAELHEQIAYFKDLLAHETKSSALLKMSCARLSIASVMIAVPRSPRRSTGSRC